jgi:ribosomal protein L11 methyltransferase
MTWTGIAIIVADSEAEDAVVDLLLNAGCAGVALGETDQARTVTSYILDDTFVEDRVRSIRAALTMLPHLGISGIGEMHVSRVDEEDWANSWKAYFKPIRIGKRLVVSPPWETPELRPRDLLITIDPGMAFGTGTHATTQLCMALLEDYLLPGHSVGDIGTGSGILSICASKLGAASITAIDIDPLAVKIAAENAKINEATIHVTELFPRAEQFDLVVANIIAETLIQLADDLAQITRSEGILIASGIIEGRQDDVRIFIEGSGFTSLETRSQGEWIALVFRRTAD